jgi:Carboxylesterase family
MRTGLPLVVWLGLLVACGARAPERHAPDPALRRTTTSGDVVGFVGPYGNAAWLGIPYAAPPVGSMRWRAPAPPARAAHGFEIPFIFGHFDLGRQGDRIFTAGNAPGRETLSAQMMGYWAQFARTGDPGQGTDGTQPLWPRRDGTPRYLVLDTPAGGGVRTSTDGVTSASVVAAVDADARLRTQRDKCRVFRTLASWGRGFDRADYPTAGAHGCAQYPFDSFPWPD